MCAENLISNHGSAIDKGYSARLAKKLFSQAPRRFAWMQKFRPYICPFDLLTACVPQNSTVLDIGCGCGLLLGLLRDLNRIQIGVGLDSDSRAVAIAKQMANHLHYDNLKFEVCSNLADWPARLFSVVTMIDVLHHIPPRDQRQFFHDSAERVRPGGILLFKDMVARPSWLAAANRLHDLVVARQWIHYVLIGTVDAWAKNEDLRLKETNHIRLLWYGHELRVYERPLPRSA